MPAPRRKPRSGVWQDLRQMAGALRHEHEISLFILVSLFDILMTWLLLNHRSPDERTHFTESNPVARYFLDHWGMRGMIYFKFGMVAFIAVLAEIVAHSRPKLGRAVLQIGIVVVSCVVVYSLVLLLRAHGAESISPELLD